MTAREGTLEFDPVEWWNSRVPYSSMKSDLDGLGARHIRALAAEVERRAEVQRGKLSQNDKRWRLIEHGCEWVSWKPLGGKTVSFDPRHVQGLVAMRKQADETLEDHLAAIHAAIERETRKR